MNFRKIVFCIIIFMCLTFPINADSADSPYYKEWDKLIGTNGSDSFLDGVQLDNGAIVSVGSSGVVFGKPGGGSINNSNINDVNNGDYDALVYATDEEGKWLFDDSFGGDDEDAFAGIAKTKDGGFVAAGHTYSSNNGEINFVKNGQYDAIIVKYKNDGTRQWIKNLGKYDRERFRGVTVTKNDEIVAVGIADAGALITKFDKNGNLLWNKKILGDRNESFVSVETLDDGNIIAVGRSASTTLNGQSSHGGYDGLIMTFDSSGNTIWTKLFGGDKDEELAKVIQTQDKNIVIAGYTKSSENGDISSKNYSNADHLNDALLFKIKPDGTKLWDTLVGGTIEDKFRGVCETKDGDLIAVGTSYFSHVYSNINDTTNGGYDGLIVGFDKDGNKKWDDLFGGDSMEELYFSQSINKNRLVVGGWTYSSNTGEITGTNHALEDGLLVKFKTNNPPMIFADETHTFKLGSKVNIKNDYHVKADDKEDGDLTNKVKIDDSKVNYNKIGKYSITLSVTDSDGNTATKVIEIVIVSNEKPIITADDTHTIIIGSKIDNLNKYYHAKANDKEDGDLTSKIQVDSSKINYNQLGSYTITFSVKDSDNNHVEKKSKLLIINELPDTGKNNVYLIALLILTSLSITYLIQRKKLLN